MGEDNIICAQTGLAGGSILEKNVLLAGQVGISGHLTIHDNAVIYAQSGIGGDVAGGRGDVAARPRLKRANGCAPSPRFRNCRISEDSETIGEAFGAPGRRCNPVSMIDDNSNNSHRPVAYLNETFLESPDARGLRILSEYLDPLSHFRDEKIQDTIVFFGSARISEEGPARPLLSRCPDAGALGHRMVQQTGIGVAPLRDLLRRRPGHHGGGQSRRGGCGRQDHRPQHRPAVRAAAQSVHHAGTVASSSTTSSCASSGSPIWPRRW